MIEEIITQRQDPELDELTVEDVANHLNALLIEAVKNNDFSHAIFQVGRARGGNNSQGGVLWEDVSEMFKSAKARDVPQVIAHNPPRGKEPPVRITPSERLVVNDPGLNPCYGGNQAYVIFRGSKIIVRNKEASGWKQVVVSK